MRGLLLLAFAPMCLADNSLVDEFVALFTDGNMDRAEALVDALEGCTPSPEVNTLFRDMLSSGINATRTCGKLNLNREEAKECVTRGMYTIAISTSPYKVFTTQPLDTEDERDLTTCGNGDFRNDAEIIDPIEVIVKRFVGCDVDMSDNATKDAVLEIFQGTGQMPRTNRALLATLCTSVELSGTLHNQVVRYVTETLKHLAMILPNRR